VLKSQDEELLPVYDEHLAAHGLALQERRAEACRRFSTTFSTLFAEVSGLPGELRIEYRPSWRAGVGSDRAAGRGTDSEGSAAGRREDANGAADAPTAGAPPAGVPDSADARRHSDPTAEGDNEPVTPPATGSAPAAGAPTADAVRQELERRRDHDRYMRTTTSGPHRDRFLFLWDGEDFTRIASTGQVRLASLLLRVAQAQFFSVETDRKAVLLLDDVLLELDPTRRARFLEVLPAYEQAFFTFLPDEHFTRFRKADTLLYRVANGSVLPYEESR
jgi:recombinational DNA repair ATPase RecF